MRRLVIEATYPEGYSVNRSQLYWSCRRRPGPMMTRPATMKNDRCPRCTVRPRLTATTPARARTDLGPRDRPNSRVSYRPSPLPPTHPPSLSVSELGDVELSDVIERNIEIVGDHGDIPQGVAKFLLEASSASHCEKSLSRSRTIFFGFLSDLARLADEP